MDPVLAACVTMMGINDHLLGKALEGLSAEEAWRHPGDANPIYWMAGHIAVYRHSLASTLGAGSPLPWAPLFKIATEPDPAAVGPSLDDIRGAFSSAAPVLASKFAELTEADLAAQAPFKLPTPDPTVRGVIAFFTYHEAYHLGQIAYVRKWLGYPGVVDGK